MSYINGYSKNSFMAIVHSNSRLIVIVLIGIVRVVVRIVVINTKNIENNKANNNK